MEEKERNSVSDLNNESDSNSLKLEQDVCDKVKDVLMEDKISHNLPNLLFKGIKTLYKSVIKLAKKEDILE